MIKSSPRKPARGRTSSAGSTTRRPANPRLFSTPAAGRVKKEICAVGRKLWLRQFVDGNGGNISYRIGPNEVLCTPTLVSKYDLTPSDLCLVDLDGKQIAGARPATSEILLHLEIYKKVPGARGVVHCHPPHATAYAITGLAPATLVVPEYEILVGQVAIAPYETPGTPAFARTVLPFVEHHNAVLLSNHGVVCWADSVTVAEWHCEVLETYCTVLTLARQLGAPLAHIPEPKHEELRARRRSLGLPDVRKAASAKQNGRAPRAASQLHSSAAASRLSEADFEALVERVARRITIEVLKERTLQ